MATGNAIRDQLAAIMEAESETIDDEDLLTARWLEEYGGFGDIFNLLLSRYAGPDGKTRLLRDANRRVRRANIRERRRELKKLYPYSDEEEARRQKRGMGGPP